MAVGTELLLGQIADTNSAWLGEHLAAAGVTSQFHQAVGDNHERHCAGLPDRAGPQRRHHRLWRARSDPQDDITREAIAEMMGVELECRSRRSSR